MSQGRLATMSMTANTAALVYTAPQNCLYMEVDVAAVNPAATDATLQLAVTNAATAAAVTADEYIEKGKVVAALGGTYDVTSLKLSPGESIMINASQAIAVRVSGRPVTRLN